MARRATWSFMGLQDNCEDPHRGNSLQTAIRVLHPNDGLMALYTMGVGYSWSLSNWDQKNVVFGGKD